MASPGRVLKPQPEVHVERDAASEAPASFRFEITWQALAPVARPAPIPAIEEAAPPSPPRTEVNAPNFASVSNSPTSQRLWKWLLCLVILAAAVIGLAMSLGRKPEEAPAAMNMGGAGWVSEWVSDPAGSARGRQLSLYRPSGAMSDFRFEFTGQIARQSLDWAFRVADTKNYYVGKLGIPSGGPLTFTRFAVIRGAEGPHHETPVRVAVFPLNVKLEANGSKFTLYIQKQLVEEWEDNRLIAGMVGFLNERQEQGQVDSVQISFLKPGARP